MQNIHIGEIIKKVMKKRKISVTKLSQEIHCDRTNIYSIFKRKSIDTELLVQISNALHYDFLSLYTKELTAINNDDIGLTLSIQRKGGQWTVEEICETFTTHLE